MLGSLKKLIFTCASEEINQKIYWFFQIFATFSDVEQKMFCFYFQNCFLRVECNNFKNSFHFQDFEQEILADVVKTAF